MGQADDVPFEGCYRIDDQLMAGPYPGARIVPGSDSDLDALLYAGMDCFIDLTVVEEGREYGRPLPPYESRLRTIAEHRATAVEYRRFPIFDMEVPDLETMIAILDAIDAARARGRRVYVHCLGGVGRTGTVIGCWLARHAIAVGRQALHAIDTLRQYEPERHMRSPQTREQCSMVRRWEPGQ